MNMLTRVFNARYPNDLLRHYHQLDLNLSAGQIIYTINCARLQSLIVHSCLMNCFKRVVEWFLIDISLRNKLITQMNGHHHTNSMGSSQYSNRILKQFFKRKLFIFDELSVFRLFKS